MITVMTVLMFEDDDNDDGDGWNSWSPYGRLSYLAHHFLHLYVVEEDWKASRQY